MAPQSRIIALCAVAIEVCVGVQAQSAEEDLNGAVKKAESLLKLAEMCRRLETAVSYTHLTLPTILLV